MTKALYAGVLGTPPPFYDFSTDPTWTPGDTQGDRQQVLSQVHCLT